MITIGGEEFGDDVWDALLAVVAERDSLKVKRDRANEAALSREYDLRLAEAELERLRTAIRRVAAHAAAEDRTLRWITDELLDAIGGPQSATKGGAGDE